MPATFSVAVFGDTQCVKTMSRRGNPGTMRPESFFATLKKELVRNRAFDTRAQTRGEIFECIEVLYNRERAHSYKTPEAFEYCFDKKHALCVNNASGEAA
jgi:putative transposase